MRYNLPANIKEAFKSLHVIDSISASPEEIYSTAIMVNETEKRALLKQLPCELITVLS